MDQENQPNKNHSLGSLGPAKKTKPKSPDCTGKVKWSRLSEQNFRVDKWSLCRS
jgi:hypothetical protein